MFPLSFEIGKYTIFFLALSIFPYLSSGIFSLSYIKEKKGEFRTFFFLTFLVNILVFFSKDILTFLFLFELLSLVSFPLIIYERDKDALLASKLYFMFSILSGLLIIAGLILLKESTQLSQAGVILITLGLLIKCGAYPFHVWLPKAHPVAPSPASAILSGCIIKVGFFGLVKLAPLINLYNPPFYGEALLIISIITMFYGVLQALFQENSKVMLAYHSVSQMGYILAGFSVFAILKSDIALSGALFHAMNHAYFKSALFLSIGSIFLEYRSVNMYKVRGFFYRNRIVSILFLIGVLGISGVPLFNGFISKSLLHEALLEEKTLLFRLGEIIFLITAVGTFVSNFKMYYLINFRRECSEKAKLPNIYESLSLLILGALIILFGLFPLSYGYIIPNTLKEHIYLELGELTPFNHLFRGGIGSFAIVCISSISLLIIGLKKGIFHKTVPFILDPYLWWFTVYSLLIKFFKRTLFKAELSIIKFFTAITRVLGSFKPKLFEKSLLNAFTYIIIPEDPLLPLKASKKALTTDRKISRYYNELFSFLKFLFMVAHTTDKKEAKNYERFLKNRGRALIIALIIVTVLLTVSFILLIRYL